MDQKTVQNALSEYKEGLGHLAHKLPKVAQTYHQFTEACFAEGRLDKKTKHLIGISLGVYSNDEYCIIYHSKGAVDHGATEEEILEATAVTSAFGGGMAMSQAVTTVQSALSAFYH